MINNYLYRLSVQHAHPLGPWQAILGAVQSHHSRWTLKVQAQGDQQDQATAATIGTKSNKENIPLAAARKVEPLALPQQIDAPIFRVLDLASGPRGEPGTTIAHALPFAAVHCTDSCSRAVAVIPIAPDADAGETKEELCETIKTATQENLLMTDLSAAPFAAEGGESLPPLSPPTNLTKSIQDLTDLSSYDSNSMDAIVCCYGYGLSSDIPRALVEAHRVLVPGGILVIASWQQSAMLSIGRDVLAYVRSGGSGFNDMGEDDALFLPPQIKPVDKIEWSGVGELESLLQTAGFLDDQPSPSDEPAVAAPAAVATTRDMVYPYDLGSTVEDQFTMGTILVRQELESLGALKEGAGADAGGWNNLAEEGFWMNIRKYIDMVDGTMLLKDNVFKLTVSTKSP